MIGEKDIEHNLPPLYTNPLQYIYLSWVYTNCVHVKN